MPFRLMGAVEEQHDSSRKIRILCHQHVELENISDPSTGFIAITVIECVSIKIQNTIGCVLLYNK